MISDGAFRKNEHILKSKEFREIYKKGRSVKKNGFVLCVMPNGLEHSRLGFSIGSRSVKLASTRNKIRRYFREIFRINKSSFRTGFDMVIIARKNPGKHFLYASALEILIGLAREAGIRS